MDDDNGTGNQNNDTIDLLNYDDDAMLTLCIVWSRLY